MLKFKLHIPFVELEISSQDINKLLTNLFNTPNKLIINTDSAFFHKAINNLLNFLIEDQIDNGIGHYGWSKSDQLYLTEFYSSDFAKNYHDSIMSSVLISKSLRTYLDKINAEQIKNSRYSEFINGLNHYYEKRWNPENGSGGILIYDRHNQELHVPTYRHTARLMQYWLYDSKYFKRIKKSLEYIIVQHENVKWDEEPVTTDVTTYNVINHIINTNQLYLGIYNSQANYILDFVGHSIKSKYNKEISGWSIKDVETLKARQFYTLYVLAETIHLIDNKKIIFREELVNAWESTLSLQWSLLSPASNYGFSYKEINPNLLCLGMYALTKKSKLNSKEYELKITIFQHLMNLMHSNNFEHCYGWALSYFLQLIADSINK